MNHGIARVGDICPNLQAFPGEKKKPEKPVPVIVAPKHVPPKVVGDPGREPVNKQAALIIARAPAIYKPLPPEPLHQTESEWLKARITNLESIITQVKNENAALIRRNEKLLKQVLEAHKKIAALTGQQHSEPEEISTPTPSRKAELLERLKNGTH